MEPATVGHAVPECGSLIYTIRRLVLVQCLIVLANSNDKDEALDALEAVYPLFALGSLSADVEDAVDPVNSIASVFKKQGNRWKRL